MASRNVFKYFLVAKVSVLIDFSFDRFVIEDCDSQNMVLTCYIFAHTNLNLKSININY